jgi:ubiquinone/menaquinone biosynthesis C-methylase UbiE
MHQSSHTHAHSETSGALIRWATLYDLMAGRLVRASDRPIVALAGIRAGDAVLDVGCGPGSLTRAAKDAAGPAGAAHGIDAAPEMIARARQNALRARTEVDFRVAAAERLPFADNTFDTVMSRLAFHHLPGDLKRQALVEIWRVLKPGGQCFVVDFEPSGAPLLRHIIGLAGMGAMAQVNVQAYAGLFEEQGFEKVELGGTSVAWLAFVRGRKPTAS